MSRPTISGSRRPSSRAPRRLGSTPSRGAMVGDICLVVAWGALIPGLMWLGAAAGF